MTARYVVRRGSRIVAGRRTVIGAGLAGLFVAACGGSTNSNSNGANSAKPVATQAGSNSTAAPAGTAAARAASSPAPKSGGTLTEATTQSTADLDPHASPTPTMSLSGRIFNTLLQQRMVADGSAFEVKPSLAAQYEQPDPQTYIFHIAQGVKFHNKAPLNGRALTADDIVNSINLMATPPQAVAAQFIRTFNFEGLNGVQAVDASTVKLSFSKPFSPFLTYIADPYNVIYAADMITKYGPVIKDQAALVGTGPFMLDSYTPSQNSKVVKNPNYYLQGLPYLDAIETSFIADESTRIANLRSGSVHMLGGLTKTQVDDLLRTNKDLKTGVTSQLAGACLMFNLAKQPVDDQRLRQAIDLALDRDEMVTLLLGGDGQITGAPIPPGLGIFSLPRPELESTYKVNIAKAQQMLKDAGITTPIKIPFMGTNLYSQQHSVIQAQLAKVGIILDPFEQIDYATFTSRRIQKDYTISFFIRAQYADPEEFMYKDFHSVGGSRNYYNYKNTQFDALMDQQRGVTDPAARAKVLEQAQRMIMSDRPLLSLYVGTNRFAWYPQVQGFIADNLRSDAHTFDVVWQSA